MMIDADDYKVYLVKLPSTVYGAVRVDRDGFYSVYVNDGLPEEKQRQVIAHEMTHIERGDLFNSLTIADAEGMKDISQVADGFRGRSVKRMSDDMWLKSSIALYRFTERGST